jgi:hypothetical protein
VVVKVAIFVVEVAISMRRRLSAAAIVEVLDGNANIGIL